MGGPGPLRVPGRWPSTQGDAKLKRRAVDVKGFSGPLFFMTPRAAVFCMTPADGHTTNGKTGYQNIKPVYMSSRQELQKKDFLITPVNI